MKIAFDHQTFTLQKFGGISRYYYHLVLQLSKRADMDPQIFTGVYQNRYINSLSSDVVSGVHLQSYPPKTTKGFLILNYLISQLSMSVWKPDIVHETYFSKLPAITKSATRVATVYDMIHEIMPSEVTANDPTSGWKRATVARADHLIAISESTKADMLNFYDIEPSRVSVTHLGVDFDFFDRRCNTPFLAEKPYLLYVGERKGYKNFTRFLTAFANSAKLKSNFMVVVFGGGKFTESEKELFQELQLDDHMIAHMSGSDSFLAQLYSGANLFVYPSLYEGFGLPPLEAMSAGCPVIASNRSSVPEVVGDAALLVDPLNIEDMMVAMEKVVFSSELSSKLANEGVRRAKLFSWEACTRKTAEVYTALGAQ